MNPMFIVLIHFVKPSAIFVISFTHDGGEHWFSLRHVREPTLLDMEAWLHERIEASIGLYLPPKTSKQNQHHSNQGYKCI